MIVEAKKNNKIQIIKLLSEHRGDNYSRWKTLLWDWQYNNNPYNLNDNPNLVCIKDGGIIGSASLFYCRIKFYNELVVGAFAWDFIVSPNYRRLGFGTNLGVIRQEKSSLTLHFGISDMSYNIHKKNGGMVDNDICEYFLINKIESKKDFIKKLIGKVNHIFNGIENQKKESITVSVFDKLPGKNVVDGLWDKVKDDYEKIVVRDYDYLKWKYMDHPLAKYDFVVVNDMYASNVLAVAVFRYDKCHSRFVDYLGPSDAANIKDGIVKKIIEKCICSQKISCIVTDYQFRKILKNNGFYRYSENPRFSVASEKYNNKGLAKNWFLMAGDSDDDLLVAAKAAYEQGET